MASRPLRPYAGAMPCPVASGATAKALTARRQRRRFLCGAGLVVAATGAAPSQDILPDDTLQPGSVAPNGVGIAATCMTCHHPSNAHIPWLERPSAAAIRAQAQAQGTVMHRLMRGLTDAEIEAVAAALALAPEG